MSDAFSQEQVAQIKAAVVDALSQEQVAQIKAAVVDALSEVGLRIDGLDHQDEAREDFRFVRRLRKAVDGASAKIGLGVILAILSGVVWLFTAGMNVWKGH